MNNKFLNIRIIGKTSNRRSKGELNALLFAIEDYIKLKKQMRIKVSMYSNEGMGESS